MAEKTYNIEGNNNDIKISINLKKGKSTEEKKNATKSSSSGVTIDDIVKELQDNKSDLSKEVDRHVEEY